MSSTYSTTQAGNITAIVGILVFILNYFKINIGSEELTAFIGGVLGIVGIATSWYGRYKKGDLTIGGFRK